MSAEVQGVIATALALPAADRALVAQKLLESLEEDPAIDAAWAREAEDRLAAFERGELQGLPYDEVMRELRGETTR
jgi:putative addiction module component (TIGR02574 family)